VQNPLLYIKHTCSNVKHHIPKWLIVTGSAMVAILIAFEHAEAVEHIYEYLRPFYERTRPFTLSILSLLVIWAIFAWREHRLKAEMTKYTDERIQAQWVQQKSERDFLTSIATYHYIKAHKDDLVKLIETYRTSWKAYEGRMKHPTRPMSPMEEREAYELIRVAFPQIQRRIKVIYGSDKPISVPQPNPPDPPDVPEITDTYLRQQYAARYREHQQNEYDLSLFQSYLDQTTERMELLLKQRYFDGLAK
jgi:hypothetical protein